MEKNDYNQKNTEIKNFFQQENNQMQMHYMIDSCYVEGELHSLRENDFIRLASVQNTTKANLRRKILLEIIKGIPRQR
jgi:hypothetical protein